MIIQRIVLISMLLAIVLDSFFVSKSIEKTYVTVSGKRQRIYNQRIVFFINGKKLIIKNQDAKWYLINGDENVVDKELKYNEKKEVYGVDIILENVNEKSIKQKLRWVIPTISCVPVFVLVLGVIFSETQFELSKNIDEEKPDKTVAIKDYGEVINLETSADIQKSISYLENNTSTNVNQIENNVTFVDREGNTYSANDLVGRKICVGYQSKDGMDVVFLGQYDSKLAWDGECDICCYYNEYLVYSTTDVYVNGKLQSYKRVSISEKNNAWMYTERDVLQDGTTNGDTWRYKYKEIDVPNYNIDAITKEDVLTVDDVVDLFSNVDLISHYHGKNDSNSSSAVNDDTGNAYRVEYIDGNVKSVFKGIFFNGRYISGILIEPLEDGKYRYSKGVYRDEFGNEVYDDNMAIEYLYWYDLKKLIKDEEFAEEIFN